MVQIFSIGMVTFTLQVLGIMEFLNNHPAIIAALIGGLVALFVKFIDKWLDGRNKTIKTADKVLEIETAEKEKLKTEQKELMKEQQAWWKLQNDRLKAEHFEESNNYKVYLREAREINHSAINQIMAQQNIILGMQREMILQGMNVPEVSMLELSRFMLPVWKGEKEKEDDLHKTDTGMVTDTEK